jgi:hypothetical protein
MALPTMPSSSGPKATLKAYEDKINAQLQEAKDRLAQFDAKARAKDAAAEAAAVKDLHGARQNIDRRLQDLKTTHGTHVSRAKAAIDAEVAKLKTSLDGFAAKFKAH